MNALIALIIRAISASWAAYFLAQQSLFVYQILIVHYFYSIDLLVIFIQYVFQTCTECRHENWPTMTGIWPTEKWPTAVGQFRFCCRSASVSKGQLPRKETVMNIHDAFCKQWVQTFQILIISRIPSIPPALWASGGLDDRWFLIQHKPVRGPSSLQGGEYTRIRVVDKSPHVPFPLLKRCFEWTVTIHWTFLNYACFIFE